MLAMVFSGRGMVRPCRDPQKNQQKLDSGRASETF